MQKFKILSCDYIISTDNYIFVVDRIDSNETRRYLVTARWKDVANKESMQQYIEQDIALQSSIMPNWTGESWSSNEKDHV